MNNVTKILVEFTASKMSSARMRGNAEDYDAKNKFRYLVQKWPDQEEPENPDLISF